MALVGLVIIAAHSEPSAHEMAGDGADMSEAMSICLAVLVLAEVLVITNLIASYLRKLRPPRRIDSRFDYQPHRFFDNPGHLSREGPAVLQVFRH